MLILLLLPALPSGLGLALLCLSRAAALGFNQSLWVYAVELLPTAVRASGTAAAQSSRQQRHAPGSWRPQRQRGRPRACWRSERGETAAAG